MKTISKNINGIKSTLTIPWALDEVSGISTSEKIRNEQDAYKKVPLVFRAVRLRCDSLSRVPVKIFENGVEVEDWQFSEQISFRRWLWHTEASLILRGASFTVKLLNEYGAEKGIEVLNPFSVIIKTGQDDSVWFQQQLNGKTYPAQGYWSEDEMVYIREYNPTDDIGIGDSATKVSLENSRVSHYVTFFNSNFFANGAMPITLVTLPAGTKPDETKRVENFFQRAIGGIRNAFRVLGVSGEANVTTLTPDIKSLDLDKVDARTVDNIAYAFDIPKTVLTSQSANFATAKVEYQNFLSQTIWSRANFLQAEVNRQFKEYGIEIKFDIQEMPEMQADENERADAFSKYTQAGIRPEIACAILGIDIPEEYQTEIASLGIAPKETTPVEPIKSDLMKWEKKSLKRLKEEGKALVGFKSDIIGKNLTVKIESLLSEATTPQEVKKIFQEQL
jgi:HK97 family phage portal protein